VKPDLPLWFFGPFHHLVQNVGNSVDLLIV